VHVQYLCSALSLLRALMSDIEHREQRAGHSTPPTEAGAGREQLRLADMQRCIESMRKIAGDLEARVADLECSVGRIGAAFGQMAGLHEVVSGGASRSRGGGGYSNADRGRGGRDHYNRADPTRIGGDYAPPPFGNGGHFAGRGRGRRQ